MNPFSLLYSALWEALTSWPGFADLGVKASNLVRFDAGRSPLKTPSRGPTGIELMLVPGTITGMNLHASSSTAMVRRRYDWVVATGDLRVDEFLHAVEWALMCSTGDWQTTPIGDLEWPAKSGWRFVKKMDLYASQVGFDDEKQNRGVQGWTSVWSPEVEMHFRRADLHSQTGA